jgi:hypothetical protein
MAKRVHITDEGQVGHILDTLMTSVHYGIFEISGDADSWHIVIGRDYKRVALYSRPLNVLNVYVSGDETLYVMKLTGDQAERIMRATREKGTADVAL